MKKYGPLSPVSVSTKVLTATAIAIAVILLGSNFTLISAQQQQQLTPGTGEIENAAGTAATPFQSTSDSFSIQVPNGWIVDDLNNTGFQLAEELRLGYGLLAELCPEQEQGAQALSADAASAANSTTTNNRCQSAQEVVHVIRYPDLNIRMQPTSNLTQFHLDKLQEVGYRNVQIANTTDMTVNLTNPLTNETIQTVPATFADITYNTAISPNETRTGHYILTSTNNTAPNATATKGYAVFYEGNAGGINNTSGAATITPTTIISSPLSSQVAQMLDSFELIVTPEAAETLAQQAAEPAEFTEDTTLEQTEACDPSYPDMCIPPPPPSLNCDDVDDTNFEVVGSDPHGFDGDNDGIGCEDDVGDDDDNGGDDNGGDDNGGDDNGGDDNGGDDNGGDDDDDNNVPSPDDCIIIGGGDISDDCDVTPDDDDEDNGGGDIDG